MIGQSFDNIKYVSYPKNTDFNDLPIGYKQRLFIEWAIDHLTDNITERLKVSSIVRSLVNRRYKSNLQNDNFDDLPFDVDERLISRRKLYHIMIISYLG